MLGRYLLRVYKYTLSIHHTAYNGSGPEQSPIQRRSHHGRHLGTRAPYSYLPDHSPQIAADSVQDAILIELNAVKYELATIKQERELENISSREEIHTLQKKVQEDGPCFRARICLPGSHKYKGAFKNLILTLIFC
ncbi:hypothetical protein TWF679_003519 [Orbilia oligospora]|uniref:Uncharacterized protein n=1 Tax=Orbilia oligospora TaxID=2813651 RepID=A0A8H8URE6_ORBOL|nr:hypothetical protein TWF679_003519 [Orbilia oligospora]